jgi:dinuclear metal center YbgI/SA1388 family protein
MIVDEVIKIIESFAPIALQESYDNVGLITGNRRDEVKGVLICLDSTEEVVDEALLKNCNLIIAHHPIIFSGLKKITGSNYIERTIIKAIKNDIAIYAVHTNLDNIKQGVNQKICDKLKLTNTKILVPAKQVLSKLVVFCPESHAEQVRNAIFHAGAGTIGEYDECSFNSKGIGTFRPSAESDPYVGKIGVRSEEPEIKIETILPKYLQNEVLKAIKQVHPYEEVAYDLITLENHHQLIGAGMIGELENKMDEMEFLNQVKEVFKSGCVKYTKLLQKEVKRVAVCGGSGSFLLQNAISAGADVFITADFKYHQFFDADNRILIADIGHYESEQYTAEIIYNLLYKKIATFAVCFSEKNTNPINYL